MRILIIVFGIFSTSLHGQDAREILRNYLDTVSNGNIDNWNQIKSIYTESESLYTQQSFDQKVDLLKKDKANFSKMFSVFPYNHKHELYEDSSFTKLSSTFYFLEDRTIILMGNMPPIIKNQPFERDEFFSNHLPVEIWKLMVKSESVELLGIKEFPTEELECYEIKMITEGRNYYLYINPKTFLLEYWNRSGDPSLLTKFYNYKKVEDLLMPMSHCSTRHGLVYYWNNTRRIDINVDIDPEIFNYKKK